MGTKNISVNRNNLNKNGCGNKTYGCGNKPMVKQLIPLPHNELIFGTNISEYTQIQENG
jgi:hypothetical protein